MNPRTVYALALICATVCLSMLLIMVVDMALDFGPWLFVSIAFAPIVALGVVSGVDFVAWRVRREDNVESPVRQ